MLPISKIGSYCRKKRKGCKEDGSVCAVVLSDGSRKIINLGVYGSEESLKKYRELCETRRIVEASQKKETGTPISELFGGFLGWAKGKINDRDFVRIRQTCKIALDFAPSKTIQGFTAVHFRNLIDHFQDLGMHPKSRGGKNVWSRPYINKMIGDIKRVFRWGVSWDLVTPDECARVCSVPVLRRRDTTAPDRPKRTAVSDKDILATLPYMSQILQDMIMVQRGTKGIIMETFHS